MRRGPDGALRPFDAPECAPEPAEETLVAGRTGRTVERDFATGAAEATFAWIDGRSLLTDSATELAERNVVRYRLVEGDPLSAEASCEVAVELARGEWRTGVQVRSTMTCDRERFLVTTELDAYEGATRCFARRWTHEIAAGRRMSAPDEPLVLVRRSRDRAPRARAHLPARLAVRGPARRADRARQLRRRARRRVAGRAHARPRRRAARVRQRLPPPRLGRRVRGGRARHAAVPLPRLDLRPGRRPARRAADRPGLRHGHARAGADGGRHVGPVRVRQPRSPAPRRSRRRSATCPGSRSSAASTSMRCASTTGSSTRSGRTGRSRSRTTSSATTAGSTTPGWSP